LDERWIVAYLERIGAVRPERADVDTLCHLQERHVLSVPFDMIAFYTGEPVRHSMDAVRKVVDGRRGGSCFELNSAFGLLLRAVGYDVDIIWGVVYRDAILARNSAHMALRVRTPVQWLVDVAHGKHSRWPLRMDLATPQDDPHGKYLVTPAGADEVDVSVDGELLYRMRCEARNEEYGEAALRWYRTSPESPFLKRPVCIQPTESGKYTLLGNKLIAERHGNQVVEDITSEAKLLATYKRCFGIELDTPPARPPVHRSS
jgi:N-hydroxyarylamine O-acetyltransferase